MTQHDSPSEWESAFQAVAWIRKRDGNVVHFEAAKLGSSILAAHERVDYENPVFVSQELTQAVLHFLSEEYAEQIPSTQDVVETVETILREMGHPATAGMYRDYARRRLQMRETVHIVAGRSETDAEQDRPKTSWDKTRLVEQLENEADLDRDTAREVAASVERRLLDCRLSRVSPLLLDEMVFCDLMERGMERRWSNRLLVGLSAETIRETLSVQHDANSLVDWAGRQVLSRYALREVYSRDVAALLEEGVLRLLGGKTPVQWSAASTALSAESTRQVLESQLLQTARLVEDIVVLDLPSDVPVESPTSTDDVLASIRQLLSTTSRRVVVCVRSRPSKIASDSPPLFDESSSDHSRTQISRIAKDIVDVDWSEFLDRVRVDIHIRADDELMEICHRIRDALPLVRAGANVAIVVDRSDVRLVEGMPSKPKGRVVQYLGIDLLAILEHVGLTPDAEWFFNRIDLATDCAVRAGLQKREFLRRWDPGRESSLDGIVLVPLHLSVVTRFTGGAFEEPVSISFAEQLLRRMARRAGREAKHYQLPCVVDAVPFETAFAEVEIDRNDAASMAGLQVLREFGRLHAAAGGGSTVLRLGGTRDEAALVYWVAHALHNSPTHRLVLARARPARQATLFD